MPTSPAQNNLRLPASAWEHAVHRILVRQSSEALRARLAASAVLVALVFAPLPAMAQTSPQRLPTLTPLDLGDVAPTRELPPAEANAGKGWTSAAPPVVERKLKLNGLGIKYQVNRMLTIESGVRLGLASPGSTGTSSPGAFIRLQRSFGGP